MKEVFTWEDYKRYEQVMSAIEKKLLELHLEKIFADNSCYEDMSQPQVDDLFEHVKMGWIMHAMFLKVPNA